MAAPARATGAAVGHGTGLRRVPTGVPDRGGYYALGAGSVAHERVPARVSKGIGRYPVPVVILTRLCVDAGEQGRGLGSALVRDALFQTVSIADRVGVRALLTHAETLEAAAFYQRLDAGFALSPTDPLHLVLLMKDLRAAIQSAAYLHGRSLEAERPPFKSFLASIPDVGSDEDLPTARDLPRDGP